MAERENNNVLKDDQAKFQTITVLKILMKFKLFNNQHLTLYEVLTSTKHCLKEQ